MATDTNDIVECPSCGAVLTEDDLFCGECGAPRPGAAIDAGAKVRPEPSEGAADEPAMEAASAPEADEEDEQAPPPREPAGRPLTTAERWRIVGIVVTVLAALAACGLISIGLLLAFVIPDPDTGEAATGAMITAASWICFCPGALALVVAGVVAAVTLRKK